MIILAIDTSTPRLGVSLARDGEYLAGGSFDPVGTHMQQILPVIEVVLRDAGCTLGQVDAFAASIGPGSFTGIRVGVATMQALAAAAGKPCLALNTLEVCAEDYLAPGEITVPMLEARNRRIYTAAYREGQMVLAPVVEGVDVFFGRLAVTLREQLLTPEAIVLCGDETAARYAEDEQVRALFTQKVYAAETTYYRPEVLGKLAYRAYQSGRLLEPAELLPEYYAPTQAERNLGVFV